MNSKLPGVYIAKKKNNAIYYRSSLTYHGKHISLGSYDTMKKAHFAYREGLEALSGNAGIEDYKPYQLLSFEKWVSLINFRENNIYISNPIYTKQSYFYYYLNPNEALIFDIDDLFYYSSHKIIKRQGHLFVSDYGMQYNIANRYGIKNYSVLNRDYRFVNGDSHDFRYENIQILNRYHGVHKISNKDKTFYRVKIHIRSYYTVGNYSNEIHAAIAYNKAIDILSKNGIHKNYTINYIDEITNKEYADIYNSISISSKIYSLTAHNTKMK